MLICFNGVHAVMIHQHKATPTLRNSYEQSVEALVVDTDIFLSGNRNWLEISLSMSPLEKTVIFCHLCLSARELYKAIAAP